MPKLRLRRWHFDLAIFTGLAVFALCYWYSAPHPRWKSLIETDPRINMQVSMLGFSSDSRIYYTIKDDAIVGNHIPKPIIQSWDVLSGKLLAERPLQLPSEDVAILQQLPGNAYFPTPCLQFQVVANQSALLTRQHENYSGSSQLFRLFDIATGKCISSPTPPILWAPLRYLLQNSADGHHWACYSASIVEEAPVKIVDLTEGKVIYSIPPPHGEFMQFAQLSTTQDQLILVWSPLKDKSSIDPSILTVHRVGTWELLQQIILPVQPEGTHSIVQTSSDRLEISHLLRKGLDVSKATTRYRYHSPSHAYALEGNPIIEPFSFWEHTYIHHGYRTYHKIFSDDRPPPEPIRTIVHYLDRFGIHLWHTPMEQQFSVNDASSGSLLRQMTGLTELGYLNLHLDPSARYLAGIKVGENENGICSHILYLYEIPHPLWQPTLRWIMYLSWILVFPWPLRYFIRPLER